MANGSSDSSAGLVTTATESRTLAGVGRCAVVSGVDSTVPPAVSAPGSVSAGGIVSRGCVSALDSAAEGAAVSCSRVPNTFARSMKARS